MLVQSKGPETMRKGKYIYDQNINHGKTLDELALELKITYRYTVALKTWYRENILKEKNRE